MNGTKTIQKEISSQLASQPMSPRKIYKIGFHWRGGAEEGDEEACDEGTCHRSFSFQWLREEEAVVSLTCTTLEEQVWCKRLN